MESLLWNKWLWIVVAAALAETAFLMTWPTAPGPIAVLALKGGGVAGYVVWDWARKRRHQRKLAEWEAQMQAWQQYQRDYQAAYEKYLQELAVWNAQQHRDQAI